MITKRDLYEIHSEKICPYTGMASPEFAPLSAGISYRDPYYHIRASTEIIMCLNACCREPAMWNLMAP